MYSLNGYNFPEYAFPEWRYFLEWTDKFLQMNIIPWTNIIASNNYTFCEEIYVIWINLFPWQLTSISLKLNKYNSLKMHKYWVSGCKTMPWVQIYFVECECMYCISWILHHLQTANHSQLWVVMQTNTNFDLLVLCVPCDERTSCVPTKNVYVSSR